MTDLLVRYLHFIAIFVMFSLITVQHLFLKKEIENKWLKKVAVFDMAYGISALVVLFCGLGLWMWVGKPSGFYNTNWVFHTKITLFIIVGVLSFFPTRWILKNRKRDEAVIEVPKYITMIIRMELLLLCIIPLLAVLMANGVGYTQ